MAKRIKLISENGGTEIEVYDMDVAYFKSVGYKEVSSKSSTKPKSKE